MYSYLLTALPLALQMASVLALALLSVTRVTVWGQTLGLLSERKLV